MKRERCNDCGRSIDARRAVSRDGLTLCPDCATKRDSSQNLPGDQSYMREPE